MSDPSPLPQQAEGMGRPNGWQPFSWCCGTDGGSASESEWQYWPAKEVGNGIGDHKETGC